MNRRRAAETPEEAADLRRRWCCGAESLVGHAVELPDPGVNSGMVNSRDHNPYSFTV
jgi:hypothetical protein